MNNITFVFQHEESSVSMFEHLVKENNLKPLFQQHKLEDKEMEIVKELILGGPKSVGNPTLEPCNNFLYEVSLVFIYVKSLSWVRFQNITKK